jgi:hypothetical protein
MKLYFTDVFDVPEQTLKEYGAFNVSLITDLPLFIDPFLLFNSETPEYRDLHDQIIRYLRFLKSRSVEGNVTEDLIHAWYHFKEVKQNCLGFCVTGHSGHGLGAKFAHALNENMHSIFSSFGEEVEEYETQGTHLEKLCLIAKGVGRDTISDFTTNLIMDFLCRYTQTFAQQHLANEYRKTVAIPKAIFNYQTTSWATRRYELPFFQGECFLLTPRDILTRDDTWINKQDMLRDFDDIPNAIDDAALRGQINAYFYSILPKEPEKKEIDQAKLNTYQKYPQLIDYYIKHKEEKGDEAVTRSRAKVAESASLYVRNFGRLVDILHKQTLFYSVSGTTEDEARLRIEFLKDVVENKGGHHIFYNNGKPIMKETDSHILYRLTWFYTPSDISREVNDGRGPVDFKVSRGASDKTLVEFKLARNPQLRRNLEKQLEIYQKASDTKVGFKVIIYFTAGELAKVERILKDLDLVGDDHVYLIDARNDNKPSGSKA